MLQDLKLSALLRHPGLFGSSESQPWSRGDKALVVCMTSTFRTWDH